MSKFYTKTISNNGVSFELYADSDKEGEGVTLTTNAFNCVITAHLLRKQAESLKNDLENWLKWGKEENEMDQVH